MGTSPENSMCWGAHSDGEMSEATTLAYKWCNRFRVLSLIVFIKGKLMTLKIVS